MCCVQSSDIRRASPNVEFGTENFDRALWTWNDPFSTLSHLEQYTDTAVLAVNIQLRCNF